jgi:ribosomal-protein-alanine N-acetyltransferase
MNPSPRDTIPLDALSLQTTRLRLRPVDAGDADALFALHADPETMRFWSSPPWTDQAKATRTIEDDQDALRAGTSIRFVITEPGSDVLIGCCSLHHIQRDQRFCEVGYILRRSHWGRGLMHEAMTAVVDFAFEGLALLRLEADIDPRNEASARTVVRLGFTLEALMRERWLVDGVVSDSAIYGLLREQWQGRIRSKGACS